MSASRKNSRARSDVMTYWTATCAAFSATGRTLQQDRAPALRESVIEILACEGHGVGGDDVAKGIVRRLLDVNVGAAGALCVGERRALFQRCRNTPPRGDSQAHL